MQSVSLITTALAGGLALAAGSAIAQPAGPPPGPSSGDVDWSGVYVGLNTGWNNAGTQAEAGSATTNQLTGVSAGAGPVTVPPATFATSRMDYGASSWAAGGQVGVNKQMGHVVLGLEGDMDGVSGRARQFSSYALPATALTTGSTVSIDRFADENWTSSLRGRVGWATGPALIYATGGLAIADVTEAARYGYAPTVTGAVAAANPGTTFGPFANAASADNTLTGWTVGGGVEWALNRAVSVGAEYRHAEYGDTTYGLGSDTPNATFEFPRINVTSDQVLAKVNFRFGPGMF